ncbi:hypothetical protein G7066_14740 [Leucobacter coleopterorum]|uniref:SD-repeat containing protein B domain-containing protein n=1 Tax=Leucobacter coleopterorum TaxID=2714933 RepID=A0ABX6K3A4_9MICO|nr:SdrD B-like domain-containing protein [Leucobacter coleopterorum]QIM19520.1 hypothetical protein G7066_14740 [Leucobacter coleopterorum]
MKKWIKDLRLPLIAKTTVSGDIQFTDVTNTPQTAGAGSVVAPYVKGYTVKLMQGATEKASTTTDESGAFSFPSLEGLTPGNYTLTFETPSGGKLVASGLNNPAVFSGGTTPSEQGVYKLDGVQPGCR